MSGFLSRRYLLVVAVFFAIMAAFVAAVAHGQTKPQPTPVVAKPAAGTVATSSLAAYLQRVRTEASGEKATPGSIWVDSGRLARMTTRSLSTEPRLIQRQGARSLKVTWPPRWMPEALFQRP